MKNSSVIKELIILEKKQTSKWFLRMFYVMALIPTALLLEAVFRKENVISASMFIISFSIMLALILYGWAMFKSFHNCIFCNEESTEILANVPSAYIVLFKLSVAIFWLLLLVAAFAVIICTHTFSLSRLPEEIVTTELIQYTNNFVKDNFGEGKYLYFSAITFLLQAITLISITHVSAAASHMSFFERYKTLAGIFIFVLLYFFENDFAGVMKRILINFAGGVEKYAETGINSMLAAISAVEICTFLIITAINVFITTYFLNKTTKGDN